MKNRDSQKVSKPTNDDPAMQGEGNRTAARNYEAGVKTSVAKGNVEKLAQEAKRALGDTEAAATLRGAEQRAATEGRAKVTRPSKPSPVPRK
jgi:hypothetical protein